MKKHKLLIPLLATLFLAIILYYYFFSGSASDIPTYTVKRGTFNVLVIEAGTVRAKNSFTVSSPRIFSGSNLQIVSLAPEGTTAKVGDVLARFDPTGAMKRIGDKETELKSAQSDYTKMRAQQAADEAQSKADYENAKLSFELAKIAKERMQFESEARRREAELEFAKAEISFKQAELNLKNKGIVRRSELGNLQLRLQQIKGDIDIAKKDMEELTIKAPISGLIVYETNWSTGRKIAVGDQPWPGMTLISLPDLSAAQVVISVNEMDISKVKVNQKVEITPDAFPDKKFSGKIFTVSQIGSEKGMGSNVKVFETIVDIEKTEDILKPGITTTNKIIVDQIKNVLSIPIEAVVEKEGKTYVYVPGGRSFSKVEIKVGAKNDNFVVVKEGLKEGMQVALRNPEEMEDAPGESKKDKPSIVSSPTVK